MFGKLWSNATCGVRLGRAQHGLRRGRRIAYTLLRQGIFAVALLIPSAAFCQDDPALEVFRQHMRVGVDFYGQKNYVAAILEFEEAYKAKPKASPLVNMALCHKAMFAYPKAVRALETALEKHTATMTEDEQTAAKKEIDEMRVLLAYVTFKVTPNKFLVVIDNEPYPDAALGKAVSLSPGPHNLKIIAEGYATIEEQVKLASGLRNLEYTLLPNMGFVRIAAAGPKFAIAVDQKALDYGSWSGLLPPGPHVIEMYVPGSITPPHRVRLDVEVGKTYEVTPTKGGTPIVSGGGIVLPPPPPPKPAAKPIVGPFVMATFSVFGPTEQPAAFAKEDISPGVSVGLRGGYRVNTPVSFDAMIEYANMLIEKSLNEDIKYNLEQFRGGINMRLQTPGSTARFYGSLGGGVVYDDLEFTFPKGKLSDCLGTSAGPVKPSCTNVSGVDGYFLLEAGLQLSFGGVLVDAAIGTYLQSTRGFGSGTYRDWLPIFQGGLRVGYGFWSL